MSVPTSTTSTISLSPISVAPAMPGIVFSRSPMDLMTTSCWRTRESTSRPMVFSPARVTTMNHFVSGTVLVAVLRPKASERRSSGSVKSRSVKTSLRSTVRMSRE